MKRTVIDIQEISDSKEVYGQRPNPLISIFIYCLVGLLTFALGYSFFGEIEIVASASGVIRPNDDVSTVSCLLGGKITGVNYSDGQFVQKGDELLIIDTAEAQITLNSLLKAQEDKQLQIIMIDKFVDGIENGSNPFLSEPESDEYQYYIRYRDYELSLQNAQDTFEYDTERTSANVNSINKQIAEIQAKIAGLSSYRDSILNGENLASAYPEYANMYELYVANMSAIDSDYQAQKEKIELDNTADINQYYLNYYQECATDYGYLVSSIQSGTSTFPFGMSSTCALLYNNYTATLAEYRRSYNSAVETYNYYAHGGNLGNKGSELLAYDKSMLEGYNYYKQSVEMGEDVFSDTSDSVYYRSLYVQYKIEYDALFDTAFQAEAQYEALLSDPNATEEVLNQALLAKTEAENKRDDFRTATLAAINNTILQIQADIAEKELSIGQETLAYNIENARIQMEGAAAAISTYKYQMLAEYSQTLSEFEEKVKEYQFAGAATQDKESLLSALETSYHNSKETQYYQTISNIDTSLQSLKSELISAQSNLRIYQIANSMYANNTDENGKPLAISLPMVEEVSSLLGEQESAKSQLEEINAKIQQIQEQISQGTIMAERNGTINAISKIVTGDTISAGTTIATIIPLSESEYKVQLYVSNSDIANIEVGDSIRYNLAALPSNQYGTVSGTVTSISTDALIQDGQYSGYFLVEGSIASTELSDKDGNIGSIGIGMQVEAKIVTQNKSIIRYLLEKINLF